MKIALNLIVKGTDDEALLLDRCLENVSPYVDGIFITSTHKKGEEPNKMVEKIAKLYKANVSTFEWCNDFAKARNFNFSQVPKEYDYILWCDADDVFRGLETLKDTIEHNKMVDVFAFWYMYDFDEYNQPVVVHKKSQLVRNDGCVSWAGALHEDFVENRSVITKFVDGIERMHLTTDERVMIAKARNIEVSLADAELHPEDPRSWWNLGNSYMGNGENDKAKECFVKFLGMSSSDMEKYIVRTRLASLELTAGNNQQAVDNLYYAIGMSPNNSDAYLQLGYVYFEIGNYDKAEEYLLMGLVKKPNYHGMIVYNPRDYDYNPMMLLAKVYFEKNRPDLALPMLKGCLGIYPNNEYVKGLVAEMEKETKRLNDVVTLAKELETITDKVELKKRLEEVDVDLRSHPAICAIRNKVFIKETSSGKDLVYFCGMTDHEWNPELFKTKGFGGSEEAVINLSKAFAKDGWNVTVYNNCGTQEMIVDGVTYKPFWEFNYRDKQDVVIIWRHPRPLDFDINADKIFVDVHDVISPGEFNDKRLEKVTGIFFKTNFHRQLFPLVPDNKCFVVPNGIDFGLFNQDIKKDQYLLINTSSPDRSMDVMPKLFKKIKDKVPQAKMKWAYGWNIYDQTYKDDAGKMKWRNDLQKEIDEAGIESLGKISQQECAKLYLEGNIMAYPSEFAEIDCISVKKAQACGCVPITTDFGAFNESVQYGVKIPSKKTNETWCKNFQVSFGIEDEQQQDEWVNAVVEQLQKPIDDRSEMKEWSHKFEWSKISDQWIKNICQ